MKKKVGIIIFAFLVLFLITITLIPDEKRGACIDGVCNTDYDPKGKTRFGLSHPPFNDAEKMRFTGEALEDLNINSIRLSTDWKTHQLSEEDFSWDSLDKKINAINDNEAYLLLTLNQIGPDWACTEIQNEKSCVYENVENFRIFVETFAKRYSNKIDKMQYANEWDSNYWFIGTPEQLVEYQNIFYDEFKKHSPLTDVGLGGFTRGVPPILRVCEDGLDSLEYPIYLFGCDTVIYREDAKDFCDSEKWGEMDYTIQHVLDNARYDFIDVHMYDDVENWEDYYNKIKSLTSKPVLVTEFGVQEGGFENCPLKINEHDLQVNSALETIDSLEVPEAYYFNLVEGSEGPHDKSGLLYSGSLEKKPAYYVFKEFNK